MAKRMDEIEPPVGGNGDSGNSNSNSKRNSNSGIYSQLNTRLELLSFQAFRTLVFLWLNARGYRQVQVLKRSASRGRRPAGGPDFLAISPYLPRTRVAIQIRHWQSPVQKRTIDEMRGWMLRLDIPQGLIVTRSTFYPGAQRAARELKGKPVTLWPAPRLAGSMSALGLGVDRMGSRLEVADWFFGGLSQIRLGYSFKKGNSKALTAKRGGRPWLPVVVGPGFAKNWPDGIWRAILILLEALLIVLLIGRAR